MQSLTGMQWCSVSKQTRGKRAGDSKSSAYNEHSHSPTLLRRSTRARLVSADSLGMVAAWDVFPVSRRLCKVQAHSDSVQASLKCFRFPPVPGLILRWFYTIHDGGGVRPTHKVL